MHRPAKCSEHAGPPQLEPVALLRPLSYLRTTTPDTQNPSSPLAPSPVIHRSAAPADQRVADGVPSSRGPSKGVVAAADIDGDPLGSRHVYRVDPLDSVNPPLQITELPGVVPFEICDV